jgi:hypothetical protein
MNFTPRIKVPSAVAGVLTVVVVGLMGWGAHVASGPRIAVVEHFQTTAPVPMAIPAVEAVFTPGSPAEGSYYQPVSSWYRNKHWWKRNAPIVGGVGGGALVGGLVGGGTGALVGGAVGGGGGYLYKRSRRHHEYNHHHE